MRVHCLLLFLHIAMYTDLNYCLCCYFQFNDSKTIFCRSQKCSLWCLLKMAMAEYERVAGGRCL